MSRDNLCIGLERNHNELQYMVWKMTQIEKKVLFKAIICLLKTSLTDCVDKPSKKLKNAKKMYVESTIKLLEELL